MTKRCDHHGEDLVLYCPVCRPSHAELQAKIAELEDLIDKIYEGGCNLETASIIAANYIPPTRGQGNE